MDRFSNGLLFTLFVLPALLGPRAAGADDADQDVSRAAARVDELLAAHWAGEGIAPAAPADDATFLRRVTLDLAGRVPTRQEVQRFLSDESPAKRRRLVARLVEGPEFALHFGNVLDRMLQQSEAGDEKFLAFLRRSLRRDRPWDEVFTRVLAGPWESEEEAAAARFLSKRVKDTDRLTVDATRAFFGVDVSCAKCHDHPLVPDWSQQHYYGMKAFFVRTYAAKKRSGGIGEKKSGEAKFSDFTGTEQVAPMMFLTGTKFEDPPEAKEKNDDARYTRRRRLVEAALAQRKFLSRGFVNRVWANLFGRGLVHPVDQVHSENPPSVPGLLEFLAEDFADSGYDVRRLVHVLVSTDAYALGSLTPSAEAPPPEAFAAARLRPLTRRQYAFSLVLIAGDGNYDPTADRESVTKRYTEIESQAAALRSALDRRRDDFASSASEALFLSNHAEFQKLLEPADSNLVGRLATIDDVPRRLSAAFETVLGRDATQDELDRLVPWLTEQEADRATATRQLVWALATSAEFRFQH